MSKAVANDVRLGVKFERQKSRDHVRGAIQLAQGRFRSRSEKAEAKAAEAPTPKPIGPTVIKHSKQAINRLRVAKRKDAYGKRIARAGARRGWNESQANTLLPIERDLVRSAAEKARIRLRVARANNFELKEGAECRPEARNAESPNGRGSVG